jgi:hypothetical protein
MGHFLSIYAVAPPGLGDVARPASVAPYLIAWAEVGGIFLAGLILGAFITYIVVKKRATNPEKDSEKPQDSFF